MRIWTCRLPGSKAHAIQPPWWPPMARCRVSFQGNVCVRKNTKTRFEENLFFSTGVCKRRLLTLWVGACQGRLFFPLTYSFKKYFWAPTICKVPFFQTELELSPAMEATSARTHSRHILKTIHILSSLTALLLETRTALQTPGRSRQGGQGAHSLIWGRSIVDDLSPN